MFLPKAIKVLVMIAILLKISTCFAAEFVLKVGVQDNDGAPNVLGFGPKLATPPGIGIDIILQVAEEMGIILDIKRMPNKRIHALFSKGKFDMSGFYSYKESRLKEGVFPRDKNGELDKSKRIGRLSYYFYAKKHSGITWDGMRLTGVESVGANLGYSIVGNLEKMLKNKDNNFAIEEVKNTKQNLEKLKLGRIQAYAAQDGTIDPIIANYKEYQNFEKVGPPIKSKEYYLMFSHQFYEKSTENAELCEKFWSKIAKVRNSVITQYKNIKITPTL